MKYEVWIEGYMATGEHGRAYKVGEAEADTFQEACEKLIREQNWKMDSYNKEHNSYWACRFFDNETDARKAFD